MNKLIHYLIYMGQKEITIANRHTLYIPLQSLQTEIIICSRLVILGHTKLNKWIGNLKNYAVH